MTGAIPPGWGVRLRFCLAEFVFMRRASDVRIGRIVAVVAVIAALAPSAAGAMSLSAGNGRAEKRERPAVLPGEARTEARLLQLELSKALDRGELPVDLGHISAEAAKGGGMFSELVIEGLRLSDRAIPTVAYHSDGDGRQERNDDLVVNVKDDGLDSSLALANWYLNSGDAVGAVARLDLLSGTVAVPGVGMKANIGERGFSSEVTKDRAAARFAISLEDLHLTLDSLLPDVQLPLGTSLDMITRLNLPLGEASGQTVARLVQLMRDLALIEDTLGDIDGARRSLDGLTGSSPAVKAALAAADAAEAAAAKAAADLAAAAAGVDAPQAAVNTANAARDAANAAVAAAQADVTNATATVNALQAQVATLQAELTALQTELATTLDPARLLALPGEIAAKQSQLTSAVNSLSSAEAARTNLVAILSAAETTAVTRQAAASAAQASLAAAQAAVAAATIAAEDTQAALAAAQGGADAALAAAAASNAALGAVAEEYRQLKDRLQILLQGLSDTIAALPPLPLIEQDLDEALRASEMLSIGGIRLETMVEADANGSRNLVHCTVEEVVVLGYRPDVEECTDLIAAEKEAVRRVNEVLMGLGAVGVEGVQVLGPGGTWTEPGPVDANGLARSEGQMSALTVLVPEVSLEGVAANALAKLGPVLDMIQARPSSGILLPNIRPNTQAAGQIRAMALPAPEQPATLAEQIQLVEEQSAQTQPPDVLDGASTGSVRLVVAQARTVAEFDINRLSGADVDDPTRVCGGDPVCLAACAAGQCPSSAGDTPGGAGSGSGAAPGTLNGPGSGGQPGTGSGSDSFNLPQPVHGSGAKLPHTGAAGGLAGVALLALGGAGSRWARRRPVDGTLDRV